MKYKAKIIMGLALALAAIAVAMDHARHRVPASDAAPEEAPGAPSAPGYGGGADPATALAGLGTGSPCGLRSSPCLYPRQAPLAGCLNGAA